MGVEFDLVIVGGGIVGLSLANLLGQNTKLTVAIIEAKQPMLDWKIDSLDSRCFAINHNSRDIFKSLGIWEDLLEHNLGCYEKMHVWDASGYGSIHFSASEINTDNLGYVVENRVLASVLWRNLQNLPNVSLISAEYVAQYKNAHAKNISIVIKNTTTNISSNISAKLLVAADGAKSIVRQSINIELDTKDYQQSALVAIIETELEHTNIARQRFLPDGPLAFLPLANKNHCSIVWTSNTNNIQDLLNLNKLQFCNKLAANFSARLGKLNLLSDRLSYPLYMLQAKKYFTDHIVLVGDTAHVIHPLAGQGLNLGLLDAKILAEEIMLACKNNQYFFTNAVLRSYEKKRQGHNLAILRSMGLLQQVFGSQNKVIWVLRNIGLNTIDNLPSLKKTLMWQALGVSNKI